LNTGGANQAWPEGERSRLMHKYEKGLNRIMG
jgi:hypothetical protein